jgi:hypothetical protein
MPSTRVKSKWASGNLEFRDGSGDLIATFDGVNRKLTIASGSKINIATGGALTVNDVDKTAVVIGVAGGYKLARGVRATAAASEDVVTGLATVVSATVSLVGDPSLTHLLASCTVGDQAGAPAAGSIRIKNWKPTAANDGTPIAATAPFGYVAWIAVGT